MGPPGTALMPFPGGQMLGHTARQLGPAVAGGMVSCPTPWAQYAKLCSIPDDADAAGHRVTILDLPTDRPCGRLSAPSLHE